MDKEFNTEQQQISIPEPESGAALLTAAINNEILNLSGSNLVTNSSSLGYYSAESQTSEVIDPFLKAKMNWILFIQIFQQNFLQFVKIYHKILRRILYRQMCCRKKEEESLAIMKLRQENLELKYFL